MPQTQFKNLLLDQSKDLIWMINLNFELVYANKRYMELTKEMTGVEKKLNESVLVEGFGEGSIEKWKAYYNRALKGEYFEIEEHYSDPGSNEIKYGQITFEPLTGEEQKIIAIACQSRDITRIVKQRSEANQLMDASLDVFCTVNEQGNFVYVSAASKKHWGYLPEELIGTSFKKLILEEDLPKSNEIIAASFSGVEIRSFVNRYKKKDGSIAYNLWSARWDDSTKLRYAVAKDCKDKIDQEEKILQSEQRFKALVQEGFDLIGILDAAGNYVYVSQTSASVLGMEPEEFIGRNVLEFIHPDDVERTVASLQKITTENRVMVEPFRFKNHKKEWRWIETVLTNMLDNPAVKGIVANSRDITETVKTRRQTEASELFNLSILESSPDCLKVLDIEGRIQFMNFNGLCQMEIDNFSTFKNKNWWTLWGSENEALVKASIDKALKGETARFTAFCPTAKGTPKWWDVLVSPVGKPGEPVQRIISVSRDITEKKEEEQRLKLLESVITNTKDAVLITEAEPFNEPGPRIIYVNEAFTKMTGYSAAEVIGKTPRILQGPNSDKKELARLSRAVRNWESCEITTINYKKNGEEFWINFSLTPVADEKGWYTHWISIDRDVTEQKTKELENELLAQISINFNSENDYIVAAKELGKSIIKFGKFDWVEVWTPNLEKSQIQLLSHCVAAPDDQKFYDYSHKVDAFKIAESLAGKVWSEGAQLLWNDIENNKDFVRKDAAKKIGLKSVVGIPLMFNDEVVGVLKIGTKQDANYLKNYIPIFKRLEGYIGSELNRKKLENDLSHLFNAIPDILCLTDFKGRFLRINKAGCELLGYSEAEILYHTFDEFVHPEDKDIYSNEVLRLRQGETTFKFENRYLSKSGDIIWLSWYCNSAVEEGLIYATAKNITEEKKLRELNRQAGNLAKIGSWEVDLVNQTVFWSNEVHQMHETDPKLFVPNLETAINFYREDFRQMVQSKVKNGITSGEPFDFEAVLLTATNKELWVRAIGNAEFADGKCKRFYGSFQDIHIPKSLELRIQEVLGSISDAFYALDKDWKFTYFNKEAEQIFQTNEKEVIGKNIWQLFPSSVGTKLDEVYHTITQTLVPETFEYLYPADEKWYEVSAYPSVGGLSVYFKNIDERKIAAEKLQQAFEEKNNILESIGDGFFAVDNNWIVTYWNKEAELVLGRKKEQILGKHLWEEYPDAIDTDFYREYHKALETREAANFEAHYATINKWLEVSTYPAEEGLSVYFKDVTLRKKAEVDIRDSEEKRRLIMNGALDAIICIDTSETITFWNPQAEAIFGWKEAEVMGQHLSELIVPEPFRKYHTEGIKHYLKTGEGNALNKLLELFAIRRSGEEFPIELTIIPVNQGGELFFCAFIRDITERKKSEKSILHSNERFEKVTEATNDAIWDWDLVNQTYYRSKAIERFFGNEALKSFNEIDFWKDKFHPEDLAKVQDSVAQAIANPFTDRWELDYRVFNENGKTLYVIDRGVIIRNKEGIAIRMVGAMTDISEQKQMTVQLSELNQSLQQHALELERSNEELEQFAFVASHDLQEPLRMISSFVDLLQRKYGDLLDEKGNQYIHFATDGAKRMKQIILDLLEYSRASRLTDAKEEVDMNEVLAEFKLLRGKLISERNASIKSRDLPVLNTYKAAITQILHCLMDNALKYSREGTTPIVEMDVIQNKTEWQFSIKDNGIGIDPQFYDKIFVIFQRLHNKDQYAGTGIGLSIAKRHVEFLGGRIWLKSAPGDGTVFYFTIPKTTLDE